MGDTYHDECGHEWHEHVCPEGYDALRTENQELREALENLLGAFGEPQIVYIGHKCERYEATYTAGANNPVRKARALAATKKDTQAKGG